MPGAYKNYDDLEDSLSREEVFKLIEAIRENRYEEMKFQAALKGIDLDKQGQDSDFERVRKEAMAKVAGMSEEALELDEIGVSIQEI